MSRIVLEQLILKYGCSTTMVYEQEQHVSKINLPATTSSAAESLAPSLSILPSWLQAITAPGGGQLAVQVAILRRRKM